MEVESQLAKTCGKYGDAWGDKSCGVTLNYLRSLYSQKQARAIIVAHEHSVKRKYDMVVLMRPDVLFTRQLELKYFDETANGLFEKPPMHKSYLPSWAPGTTAELGFAAGYNDRFYMGARDGVMYAMARLRHVAEYCDTHQQSLHSERYLKWLLDTYIRRINSERTNSDGSRQLNTSIQSLQTVDSFYFRRLRANGGLVGQMYLLNEKERTPLDDLMVCSEHELAKYTKDWAPAHASSNPS